MFCLLFCPEHCLFFFFFLSIPLLFIYLFRSSKHDILLSSAAIPPVQSAATKSAGPVSRTHEDVEDLMAWSTTTVTYVCNLSCEVVIGSPVRVPH